MTKPTRSRTDRGSLSLEMAILMPAVILFVFGVVQAAVWYHARTVANEAANEAAATARAEGASSGAGSAAAQSILSRNSDVLRGSSVSVSRDATTVTVTVTGQAAVILTNWRFFNISQTVTSPRERITSPEDN
ncbi:TadE family protein [Kribbella sp. NPDC059898]|uniref:TadE family protein n=1 Tax=Kribbella sp. NPDC059898 TaxID=3346995 RepID=UPI0036521ED2